MTTMIAFMIGYHGSNELLGSTMAFATLCSARLFHGFNCKSDRPVVFTRRVVNNKFLIGAFVLGIILITAVVMIPGLHNMFKVQDTYTDAAPYRIWTCCGKHSDHSGNERNPPSVSEGRK